MKVAMTTKGTELYSQIDQRFGRAKWLLLMDTQIGLSEAHDNTVNLNAVLGPRLGSLQRQIWLLVRNLN